MTKVAVARGLLFPDTTDYSTSGTGATIDANGEKFAMIGQLYIDGRPTTSKTLSTGNIQFRTGAVTFANGGTTLDIGIQGVASGAGPIAQPDGTFTVKKTLTGGGGGLSANAWNTVAMNSGSASLTHGDLIAVVFDITGYGGADSIVIVPEFPTTTVNFPTTNLYTGGAWATTAANGAGRWPNVVIVFDDGTLGWIHPTIPQSTIAAAETFADATNPDERGMVFQVPWDVTIDGLWANAGASDANGDFTLKLYSDPFGTPTLIASKAFLAEQLTSSGQNTVFGLLATEVNLSKNTDYAITLLATGTGNSRMLPFVLGDAAHRVTMTGGTTLKKVTRNGSSGAFTAESPAVTIYPMGVKISQFDDGTGAGGHIASRQILGL